MPQTRFRERARKSDLQWRRREPRAKMDIVRECVYRLQHMGSCKIGERIPQAHVIRVWQACQ